ncbi:hypothetical protein [Paenibacillus sp. NEAU-GSW1]|uniref:hypothetical protein n=1 Tax=Paenibacillus sp. NEAU-GSW1 TaxID=2682486 RepID=UPI0012E1E4DD|nr:hypothetical protein [Paenibacillus sp. NEAU-GSW1]MUT67856.1 hypothetical protein [Paenibacillus sp. NEAU-GSW1]
MVSMIKPIRATKVEFKNEREMQNFIDEAMRPSKNNKENDRMREMMRKHREQRTKR